MTAAARVRALIGLLEGTSIGLLELTTPEGMVVLRREGADAAPPEVAPPGAEPPEAELPEAELPGAAPFTVRAPSVGVFRRAHPAQTTARLADPGRRVLAGEAVGLVQVGALLVHVTAPAGGVILDVVAADGDLVGFGTPLLRLTEEGG